MIYIVIFLLIVLCVLCLLFIDSVFFNRYLQKIVFKNKISYDPDESLIIDFTNKTNKYTLMYEKNRLVHKRIYTQKFIKVIEYYETGDIRIIKYYDTNGIMHRYNGPAEIFYMSDGTKFELWYLKGIPYNRNPITKSICNIFGCVDEKFIYNYISYYKNEMPQEYEALLKRESTDMFD